MKKYKKMIVILFLILSFHLTVAFATIKLTWHCIDKEAESLDDSCSLQDNSTNPPNIVLTLSQSMKERTQIKYYKNKLALVSISCGTDCNNEALYDFSIHDLIGLHGYLLALQAESKLAVVVNAKNGVELLDFTHKEIRTKLLIPHKRLSSYSAIPKNAIDEVRFDGKKVQIRYRDKAEVSHQESFSLTSD